MRFSRIFKSILAVLLVCAMMCGTLVSCGSKKEDDKTTPSVASFKSAYKNAIDDIVNSVDILRENMGKAESGDLSTKMDIEFDVSEYLLSLLQSSLGVDLAWLNDISLAIGTNQNGDRSSADVEVDYRNKELISAEMIMDIAKGDVYMVVPLLAEKALKTVAGDSETIYAIEALDLIPDKSTLEKVFKKYVDIVIDNISDIVYEDTTLTLGEVSEECTAYKVSLSEKLYTEIVIEILKAAKEDKDIKNWLYRYVNVYNKSSEYPVNADEFYNEFVAEINEIIEDGTEALSDGGVSKETEFEWISYISSDLRIIGIELLESGEADSMFFVASTDDGTNIGIELAINDGDEKLAVEGKLSKNGNKVSGTYEVLSNGQTMLFVDVTDLDTKKLEEGHLNGSILLSPSKRLIGEMMDVESNMLGVALSAMSIKLDFKQDTDDKATTVISLVGGKEAYLTLTVNATTSKAEAINIPTNVAATEEEWLGELDISRLISRMNEVGMPSYLSQLVQILVGAAVYGQVFYPAY